MVVDIKVSKAGWVEFRVLQVSEFKHVFCAVAGVRSEKSALQQTLAPTSYINLHYFTRS